MLLEDIEAGNTRFLQAVTGIFKRGSPEGFNPVRLNMNKNMNYEHPVLLPSFGYLRRSLSEELHIYKWFLCPAKWDDPIAG